MDCPYCGHESTKVVDKRDNKETSITRRRRECDGCSKRFTTYERIESINLYVVKRGGQIEDFDREKLKRGIIKAVGKRGIREDQVEDLVQKIEQDLLNHKSNEIKSTQIGQLVLENLLEIDKLSYLIFASVYKNFKSIEDLEKAISKVKS